jgi:hypothetical protein
MKAVDKSSTRFGSFTSTLPLMRPERFKLDHRSSAVSTGQLQRLDANAAAKLPRENRLLFCDQTLSRIIVFGRYVSGVKLLRSNFLRSQVAQSLGRTNFFSAQKAAV